eukprot:TRINITY_DN67105_c1_g7_i1.p1 TRINITY_DN67105_c1_g7~~TRINITY_DN67105_c1_g7_i1.p1  ORF type:complete len:484 (-),score=266.68 TRINITY_DN67105_c1_g7_i1:106-1557(-)
MSRERLSPGVVDYEDANSDYASKPVGYNVDGVDFNAALEQAKQQQQQQGGGEFVPEEDEFDEDDAVSDVEVKQVELDAACRVVDDDAEEYPGVKWISKEKELFVPFVADPDRPIGMRGIVLDKKYGGAKFVDKDMIQKQKGVLTDLLRQMGQNIMQGKSVINISLPVRIFEARSFLQRIADVWAYAPCYLTKAARAKDPVERLKYVVTFLVAGLHRNTLQYKPFNPILGETYQAAFRDGSRIYCEQVSHHPPVSAFQVFGPDGLWKYYGHHEYIASFRPNGMLAGQEGPNTVEFQDGTKITFSYPHVKLSGAMFGERLFNYTDTLVFEDKKNNLRCDVVINPDALSGLKSWISYAKTLSDTIRGGIRRGVGQPFDKDDVDSRVCTLDGSWLGGISFDGKSYWKMGEWAIHEPVEPSANVLPSDCRFREDLIALKAGDENLSQSEKQRLEDIQRRDRRLRQQHQERVRQVRQRHERQKAHKHHH